MWLSPVFVPSTPVGLINALENVHSDSTIKAYFYCIFLTSVTQRGSKMEFMWLEEQGGSDLFAVPDWWRTNDKMVSGLLMRTWSASCTWKGGGDAPISNTRDKVPEGKDC